MFRLLKTISKNATIVAALAILAAPMLTRASTIIPGPTVSGTWTPAGSPYIISADNEVPNGQSLTIEPGTEVVIGPDVQLTVNGSIHAVGTFDEPITIRGVTPENHWGRIYVQYGSGDPQSEFGYCNISEGTTAILLYVYADYDGITMETDIHNCTFNNISYAAVNGKATGDAYDHSYNSSYDHSWSAYQNSRVRNCSFFEVNLGCRFTPTKEVDRAVTAYGYAAPRIIGNIFSNLTDTAVLFNSNDDFGRGGAPEVHNNIMMECAGGVGIENDYYDVEVMNNIFTDCGVAVERVSANSQDVLHNCFYNNATNFANYPATYGQVIWVNDNGDPSDLLYNIFMDPQFEPGSFELSASSPCIDAGDPLISDYYNPIQGSVVSDMGAYGGEEPGAGVPPSPPVITSQPQSQSVFLGQDVTFAVDAVGYDLYYQWYFSGSPLAGETSDTLNLVGVDFADAGNYYCEVSNVYDVVNSALANLRVTEIGLDIAMHAGLHMTNLNIGTTYSIQAVPSLTDTNWVEISSFSATSDNDVWYDPEPANLESKFYQVKSEQPQ